MSLDLTSEQIDNFIFSRLHRIEIVIKINLHHEQKKNEREFRVRDKLKFLTDLFFLIIILLSSKINIFTAWCIITWKYNFLVGGYCENVNFQSMMINCESLGKAVLKHLFSFSHDRLMFGFNNPPIRWSFTHKILFFCVHNDHDLKL